MTKKEIKEEIETINKRLEKADEYFLNLDLIEVDETREYKLVRSLIKRAAYLTNILIKMEVQQDA